MGVERVQVIDLVRHVRTPAGMARFHKPIGSPLGGKATKALRKVATRVPTASLKAAPVEKARLKTVPGAAHTKAVIEQTQVQLKPPDAEKVRQAAAAVFGSSLPLKPPKHQVTPEEASRAATGSSYVLRPPIGRGVTGKTEVAELNPEKEPKYESLDDALKDPHMRAKFESIVDQHNKASRYVDDEFPEKSEIEKKAKADKFFNGLYKIAPFVRTPMEAARNSKASVKTKSAVKRVMQTAVARKIKDELGVKAVDVSVGTILGTLGLTLIGLANEEDDIELSWAVWDAERAKKANKEGGFSLNHKGESPKGGFMVSLAKDQGGVEHIIKGRGVTAQDVKRHREAAADQLKDPAIFQGAWKDEDSGATYLDVSRNVKSRKEALQLGQQHHQLAVYDVANGVSIKVPKRTQQRVTLK